MADNKLDAVDFKELQRQFDETRKNTSGHACPNCGYCPHCGRGGLGVTPFRPWYPYSPWSPYIIYGSGTNSNAQPGTITYFC